MKICNKKRIIINVNLEKSRVFAPRLMLSTKWTMVSVSYGFARWYCCSCCCWPSVRVLATSNTVNLYASDSTLYFYADKIEREREMTWGKNTVQSTLRMGKYKACFVLRSQWRCSWRWSHSPTDCAAQTENNEWMDTRKKWYVRSSGRPKWRAKHEKRQNNLHYLLTKRRQ